MLSDSFACGGGGGSGATRPLPRNGYTEELQGDPKTGYVAPSLKQRSKMDIVSKIWRARGLNAGQSKR